MITDEIKKLLRVTPFRPFTVHLADGSILPVNHPDFAFVSPNGGLVFIFVGEENNHVYARQIVKVVSTGDAAITA
jgi:hypothetical protein